MLLSLLTRVMLIAGVLFTGNSCTKFPPDEKEKNTEDYSSDLVVKWLNVQLDLLRVPLEPGAGTQAAERAQAYSGITLYDSVLPGIPGSKSMTGQLKQFPAMPAIEKRKHYYWPSVANAALAEINRKLFPTASADNKARIDSLENALANSFRQQSDEKSLSRSAAYGKSVATAVFAWASTDGAEIVNPPYVPSGVIGTWVSTPPNFPAPVNPYAYQRRRLVTYTNADTAIAPPPYQPFPDLSPERRPYHVRMTFDLAMGRYQGERKGV